MNFLKRAFFREQVTDIVQNGKYIDVRVGTRSLIKQLGDKSAKQTLIRFIKTVTSQTKKIRIISIIGTLLLHSDDHYQFIVENLTQEISSDSWINQEILRPFIKWIKKCCETASMFKQMKKIILDNHTIMDRLPYSINLLKQIVNIINSIPKFGRYYNLKDEHQQYTMLSEILVSLNNMIYSHLKTSLQHFLYNETREKINLHKEVIKWVFNQILPDLNEKIKYATLCKHFKFYQKGIVTKLIKADEYNNRVQNILNQILEQRNKSKSTEYQSLKSQIFPSDGSFDQNLYFTTIQDDNYKAKRLYSIKDLRNLFDQTPAQVITRVINLKKIKKCHF